MNPVYVYRDTVKCVHRVEAVIVATAVLHNIACKNVDAPPPPLDVNIENLIEEMNNIEFIPVSQPIGHIMNINNSTRLKLVEYFARLH
ncbi:hypothetical protein NQ314_004209 [Rhamnusium bicolor]|uniref:Nuclease HARBI1 n=1 Tax=Rhamnusium bicolor TaxID=1586634 RepID=A0AAV8ZK22_9CUCU|nr:hypothetical protein NQ314_004209 [Rhamnusium bicolor]